MEDIYSIYKISNILENSHSHFFITLAMYKVYSFIFSMYKMGKLRRIRHKGRDSAQSI